MGVWVRPRCIAALTAVVHTHNVGNSIGHDLACKIAKRWLGCFAVLSCDPTRQWPRSQLFVHTAASTCTVIVLLAAPGTLGCCLRAPPVIFRGSIKPSSSSEVHDHQPLRSTHGGTGYIALPLRAQNQPSTGAAGVAGGPRAFRPLGRSSCCARPLVGMSCSP